MLFERSFENFLLEFRKDNFIFSARPEQTLVDHISNMFSQAVIYLSSSHMDCHKYSKILIFSTLISILCHDFGKILPHFQYKLKRREIRDFVPIPNEYNYFSHHSLLSACFADELVERLNKYFIFEDCHKVLFKYLIVESILSHHSSTLLSNYQNNDLALSRELLNDYFTNLQYVSKKQLIILFSEILQKIREKDEEISELVSPFYRGPFKNFLEVLKICIDESIENFLNNYSDQNNTDDLLANYMLEIGLSTRQDKLSSLRKLPFLIKEGLEGFKPVEIYLLQCFVASLLCDLDIWDARFFKHKEFHFFNELSKLNSLEIRNYIEDNFSPIISQNLPVPIKSKSEAIFLLRQTLFNQANQQQILPNQLYMLNSPTGAGKTLCLLNSALKLADIYYEKSNIWPKIIYALPFVSIGTQVAKQVLEVFDPSQQNLINSNTITIDNYITENIWINEEHDNENNVIIGKDAKWLISTWRSHFIITTFVKLFHALLKPYKRNYLKLHRIANSIIILDEIQCLPVKYWENIKDISFFLTKVLNCTILLSTATFPAIFNRDTTIPIAKDHLNLKIKLNQHVHRIANVIDRYKIKFFYEEVSIENWLENLKNFLYDNDNEDVLIVLNTKKAAIYIYNELNNFFKQFDNKTMRTHLYMLSSLVLPIDRQKSISEIKSILSNKSKIRNRSRLIVISTQVIEAGVDISFKYVFRDFAPLDSIIQVAGRCNRGFEYSKGVLYLFKLKDEKSLFFHKVYKTTYIYNIVNDFLKSAVENSNTLNDPYFSSYLETNEKSLRITFQKYFNKIKAHNNYFDLHRELNELEFKDLAKNFSIIQGYKNQFSVLLLVDEFILNLHEKWKSGKSLNSKFYLYTISLNKRKIELLKKENVLFEVYGPNNELLYYYIKKDDLNNYYDSKTGFLL
ncbi:MAG: CRISPR-associated helicase Cas3' [Promethearchaeota archaeon]